MLTNGTEKVQDTNNRPDEIKNQFQDGIADGFQSKVLYEIAQAPASPISQLNVPVDIRKNLATTWKSFKSNPNPAGDTNALKTWLTQVVNKKIASIGTVYTKEKPASNLRENLKQLRLAGKLEVTDADLTQEEREQASEALKECDFSFWVVGVRDSLRPPVSNEVLAGRELERLSGRKNGYVEGVKIGRLGISEYETLQTIVFENLRHFFTLDQSWDDPHKQVAVDLLNKDPYMQLNNATFKDMQLNRANFKDDLARLERLHQRFLVAAIFTKADEPELKNFVVNCWSDELKVKGGWNEEVRKDVASRYGVTEQEAEMMHKRVKERS